jgi:hypothetical protein
MLHPPERRDEEGTHSHKAFHLLNSSLKPLPPNTVVLGIKFLTNTFGRGHKPSYNISD